jgi:hypothetical protein
MREITDMEIQMVTGSSVTIGGTTYSDAQVSAFYAGVAAGYATGAAIPSPLSPVLGVLAGITALGSAYYAWQAAS